MTKTWTCAALLLLMAGASPSFAHAADVITFYKGEGRGLTAEMTLRRHRGEKGDSDAKPYWTATVEHNPPLAIFDEGMEASSLDCPDFQLVLDAIEAFELPRLGPLSRRVPDAGIDLPLYGISLDVSFGTVDDHAGIDLHGGKDTPLESLVQGSFDRLSGCMRRVKR